MKKIALIIDEYFGGWNTPYGGFGSLARNYIARYIPNEEISIDVLLNRRGYRLFPKRKTIDGTRLYKLPRNDAFARRWLYKRNYDLYFSIEMTTDLLELEERPEKKLLLWIHDPRPQRVWRDVIGTMKIISDPYYYNQKIYDLVHDWHRQGRVSFITNGHSLDQFARELYRVDEAVPFTYLPSPIQIDTAYEITGKMKNVVFLARLEAQKRAWLFCEIAKRMPEVNFFVLGRFYRDEQKNRQTLATYVDGTTQNLHFLGYVDEDTKRQYLREAKILVTTSIWEGIPAAWLEALSYGTLLVSCINREDLPLQFGKYTGEIPGDGFDGVDRFTSAISEILSDDALYLTTAQAAIAYVRQTHNIPRFQSDLRNIILANTRSPSALECRR